MKVHFRVVAAAMLAVVLALSAGPAASAGQGEKRDAGVPSKLVRVIVKIQKLLGVSTQSDQPVIPRP